MTLSQEQLNLGEAVSRIVMTWIAFIGICLVTGAFLGLLFWCIVAHQDATAKIVIGFVNVFILQLLTIVFKHLFYDRSNASQMVPLGKDTESTTPS